MKKLLISVFILYCSVASAQKVADKIVAVVDNEIIMLSELEYQSMYYSARYQISSTHELKKRVLEEMINEKLLYAQAIIDSIQISDDEVNRQTDYRIQMLSANFGSKEKMEEYYGMTVEKMKREFRENVKKDLLSQMVREKQFRSVEANRKEVEEFFERYKDSIGVIPEQYELARIFINPKTSESVKQKYRDFALSLIDSINNGADFAELARKYSEDPGSAAAGGDLGFVKRGVFVPQFEAAAFALKEGEISTAIETQFGFHIIQLLERRGEAIHTRHILIRIKNTEEDDLNAIEKLSEIRDSVLRHKGEFEDFAKKYSDDKETSKLGGYLGILNAEQIDKSALESIFKLKAGEISFPKRVEFGQGSYGYQIFKVIKRIPQHKPDLDHDYNILKPLADNYKREKLFVEWVQELKNNIFWEIRL